jgi:putative membrane protein
MTLQDHGAPVAGANAARRAAIAIAIFLGLSAVLFVLDPQGFYLWAKAAHVIAVIAWMAGMLYLPRLFVYHAECGPGSPQAETFKIMERRLLRAIVNPAMIVTWAFGLYLAWEGFQFAAGWLHAKIALVILLSGLHGYFARHVRLFAQDRNQKSARHWRFMNEAPALLMVAIVVLVVVKPF